MKYDYIIIGGGIAGVTAAEIIRKKDSAGTIALFMDEPYPLYSRVLLPNYLKKRIQRERVFLRSIDDYKRQRIDFYPETAVFSMNSSEKTIQTSGDAYSYGKLLIASGGHTRKWTVPGADMKHIFQLQTLNDADAIAGNAAAGMKGVVVGGGFIALEFLEIFLLNKMEVTLLCRDKIFFDGKLDKIGAELMDVNFKKHGIKTFYQKNISKISESKGTQVLILDSRETLPANVLGVGIGIERNTDFVDAAIVKNARGIRTNEFLETNIPDVWAAGDIANYFDTFFEAYQSVGNWSNAFMQGERAGENMAGEKKPFQMLFTYNIVNLGLNIAFIGNTVFGEGVETVSRGDIRQAKYEQFFIKDGLLHGAIMINMFPDRADIAELIQKKIDVSGRKASLSDMSFSLKTLV